MRPVASAASVLLALGAVAAPALLSGLGSPREDVYHLSTDDTLFTIQQVRPGVYFAVGRAGRVVGANSTFIVTDRDVIVVDDHMSTRAARALLAEIRRVTDKPVRYVVNTHFHWDHTNGNAAFGSDIELLSHPRTRAVLLERGQASIAEQVPNMERQVAAARARLDTTRSDSVRALLRIQLPELEANLAEYRSLQVALPSATFDSSLVLYRGGGQEIRVFYMGRGHTSGDIVVQLPREGLLVTGDIMTNTAGPPNMMDGYAGEWGATLRRLAQLEFTTTLPGHGAQFDGKQRYGVTADFMDDVWTQVQALQRAGVARDSVAARLDLARHLATFPALRTGLSPIGARRTWDVAAGRVN